MIPSQQPQVLNFGDYNHISILYQLTEAHKEDFSHPRLERYQLPYFPRLSIANQLIVHLQRDRLLVLVGDREVDKHEIARYAAGCLREALAQKMVGGQSTTLDIQEWSGAGGQHIDRVLVQFLEPTIFILPGLQPQHIEYDIHRLRQALGTTHYAIVVVEHERPWYQVSENNGLLSYSYALRLPMTYPSDELASFFDSYISEIGGNLRAQLTYGADGRPGIAGIPVTQIVTRLQTPRQVREFVRQLCEQTTNGRFTVQQVETCIKAAQNGNILQRWYLHLDEHRHDHLIAVAIYLFDGLTEKQFFAALDDVINQAWRQRDPSLRAIDYRDLAHLEHFFDFAPTKQGQRLIRTKSPEERRMLLDILWEDQRRYITSALPLFSNYIKQSLTPQPYTELYSSQEWCERLRRTLTETISDIGLRDFSDIELLLLQLAANSQIGVQAVAARAIARWYETEHQQKVLGLLRQWIDGYPQRVLGAIGSADHRSSAARSNYLKETAALAIAYAAQTEARKHLPQSLLDMLLQLARDSDEHVVGYLVRYTLSMLLPKHVRQLQRVVLRLLYHPKWQTATIELLVGKYRQQPAQLLDAFDRWLEAHLKIATRMNRERPPEGWAVTFEGICTIYARLPYADVPGGLSIKSMIGRMRAVLSEQSSPPAVRTAALEAVLGQAHTHYQYLRQFVLLATAEERAHIIRTLVFVHREQCVHQLWGVPASYTSSTSADDTSTPLSLIEQEMLSWVCDPRDAIVQQVGVQASIEMLRIRNTGVAQRPNELPRNGHRALSVLSQPRVGLYPYNWYLCSIVAPLVTLDREQARPVVLHVLPEFVRQRALDSQLTDQLLQSWRSNPNETIADLGFRLWLTKPLLWIGHPLLDF